MMESLIGLGGNGTETNAPQGDLVKDSDEAHFHEDVLDASMKVPVIVDFWAPWCGPCKQLGPVLEKAVAAARGAVRLVKIDVDRNQMLAGQLQIQSIPAVYAFFQGQPVDGFMGAQPESAVKGFVERLARQAGPTTEESPLDQALEQARAALDEGQHAAAEAIFGQVLRHDPKHRAARAGVLRCKLAQGDAPGAKEMFDEVPEAERSDPAYGGIAAAIELASQSAGAGEVAELRQRVERNPADHQARFDLALALQAAGDREAAADELLEILRRDRKWNDEAARKKLLTFFEAWGPSDPLTLAARRRLSSLLFS